MLVGLHPFIPINGPQVGHATVTGTDGITIVDGKHRIFQTRISGGNVGVAAVALGADAVATLVQTQIVGAATPTQELACCGFIARVLRLAEAIRFSSERVYWAGDQHRYSPLTIGPRPD